MFAHKIIAEHQYDMSTDLLLRSLRVRSGVKEQAKELFIHVPAFGKEPVFTAARRLSRSGAIYPCSFTVLRFLSHKSAMVLEREHGIAGAAVLREDELILRLHEQGNDKERLFFLTMLCLAGTLPPPAYRTLTAHPAFRFDDSPVSDIVRIDGAGTCVVLMPEEFTEMINVYPYADYSSVRDLMPLQNFGLKVDIDEWQEHHADGREL